MGKDELLKRLMIGSEDTKDLPDIKIIDDKKPRYSMSIKPSKDCQKVTIKCEAYGKTSLEAAENAKKIIEWFVEKAKEAGYLDQEETT
jgi:hypothetical protein